MDEGRSDYGPKTAGEGVLKLATPMDFNQSTG